MTRRGATLFSVVAAVHTSDVLGHVAAKRKSRAAHGTLVRPLAGVSSLVPRHVARVSGVAAYLAAMPLLLQLVGYETIESLPRCGGGVFLLRGLQVQHRVVRGDGARRLRHVAHLRKETNRVRSQKYD